MFPVFCFVLVVLIVGVMVGMRFETQSPYITEVGFEFEVISLVYMPCLLLLLSHLFFSRDLYIGSGFFFFFSLFL